MNKFILIAFIFNALNCFSQYNYIYINHNECKKNIELFPDSIKLSKIKVSYLEKEFTLSNLYRQTDTLIDDEFTRYFLSNILIDERFLYNHSLNNNLCNYYLNQKHDTSKNNLSVAPHIFKLCGKIKITDGIDSYLVSSQIVHSEQDSSDFFFSPNNFKIILFLFNVNNNRNVISTVSIGIYEHNSDGFGFMSYDTKIIINKNIIKSRCRRHDIISDVCRNGKSPSYNHLIKSKIKVLSNGEILSVK